MRAAQNPGRTKPFGLETGRAGFDAVFFRLPVGGYHNAVAPSSPADPHRTPFQLGIERNFATGEERISVNVQNAVVAGAHRQQTRYRIIRRRPFRVVHKAESASPAGTMPVQPKNFNRRDQRAVCFAARAVRRPVPLSTTPFRFANRALVTSEHPQSAV